MFLGELAALATSVCWSFTSTLFTLAGRRVGSVVTNRMRLLLAVLFLTLTHWLLRLPLPFGAEPWRWGWLAVSGVIGLVIGDALLFQAYVVIGPRLSMLMMSLAPVFGALLASVVLHEMLSLPQWAGMVVTIAGVAWVVLDRTTDGGAPHSKHSRLGILLGLGAAAGQAVGLILAKKGLAGDFSALSGTWMRMAAAATTMWLITAAVGQVRPTFRALHAQPKTLRFILGGAFFGPFLGVTLSLVAVKTTQVGIASTLMALPPIFILPLAHFVFKEHIGWRAVAGTVVAIAGVALLAFG